jgi:RNase P subunit RPR2
VANVSERYAMLLLWICKACGEQLARLTAPDGDARLASLTAEAGEGIIEYDSAGNMLVHLLCDECLEEQRFPQSEVIFLRGPELH